MEDKKWSIYMHTNLINNKKYIGMTCNINSRFGSNGEGYLHKNKDGKYVQPYFAHAINKYGWDNFSHDILFSNLTKEEADEKEKELIALYDTQNIKKGYNIRNGGSHGCLSDETKEKLREAMLGRYDGKNNPFYGKHHSQEVIEKLKENGKKNAHDISGENNPMYNRILTPEERYARGNAYRGKERTKEDSDKIKDSNKKFYENHEHHSKGTHWSEERRKKMEEVIARKKEDKNKYNYICVETGEVFTSINKASKATGIGVPNISGVINGRQRTAGGYHWEKVIRE